jgi:hypothetical protein
MLRLKHVEVYIVVPSELDGRSRSVFLLYCDPDLLARSRLECVYIGRVCIHLHVFSVLGSCALS